MRNLFDQYSHPENRLTHALVTALDRDRVLLVKFLNWLGCKGKFSRKSLTIDEQSVVGELEQSEEEAERRGLPDGWIYDEDGWCLIIESKIGSRLSSDQLKRHLRTAERCGFTDITLLAIEAVPSNIRERSSLVRKTWSEVYEWLMSHLEISEWARLATEYFEVAERKFSDQGYLKEGSLTVFTGIPFSADNPYSYSEAKRLLRLILDEIRSDTKFCKSMGIDPKLQGRGAITGTKGLAVWDFLRLAQSKDQKNFTSFPHFTLSINQQRLSATITIPNGVKTPFRRNIKEMGIEKFEACLAEIVATMNPWTKVDPGFAPVCYAAQRRYTSQRALPIHDALIEFDLRTAVPVKGSKVKVQDQWLDAVYGAYCKKSSNFQFQIGAGLYFGRSTLASSREVLEAIKGSWLACKPFLDRILTE